MRRRGHNLSQNFSSIEGYLKTQDNLTQDVYVAADLYRQFNQFEPSCALRVHHSRLIPPVVVDLGELVGLIYRSDKWQRGQPRVYIHRLQILPRLVCNVEGSQLYIVGGNYRVTERGIEG